MGKKYLVTRSGDGKKIEGKSAFRLGFIDTLMLIIFTALCQPMGQWILRFLLNEIKYFNQEDINKLIISLIFFVIAWVVLFSWLWYSHKKESYK